MLLFKKRTIKALIRLRGCAGWSAPVLFANSRRQVFSRRGPYPNAGKKKAETMPLLSMPTEWSLMNDYQLNRNFFITKGEIIITGACVYTKIWYGELSKYRGNRS